MTRPALPMRCWYTIPIALLLTTVSAFGQLPRGVTDTQPNGDTPPTPMASLAKITVPEGFRVTLFAGEPNVHQPIAMEFDDRGRLWVAECYSYPDWEHQGKDRILIFTDSDNDGQFDERKVFAENLNNITGIALGFGGVWACSTPNFIFIPDANSDDQPDGPPVVKLDGWNSTEDVGHNVFNGMTWGPDGWMYGAHGILADSLIGKPGTPPHERVRMNCGIWRFHPVTSEFEVVAHGTTNPWGIDFDQWGQGFFTNCVIGHLWHLIPGARYERMYGTHFHPHTYTLMDACSDHLHWGGGSWQDSRGGIGIHSEAGGGHAHVGAMIYRGGTWPKEYHGSMFTANLHGNRLNRDVLQRKGSGYVATHAADFFHGNDPWLRGISVKYGPDGNVLVSDWTDLGECHDNDGTHRSSGRIYKIIYNQAEVGRHIDLARLPTENLPLFAEHPNAWFWYHARRLLHERAAQGEDMSRIVLQAKVRLNRDKSLSSPLKLCLLDMLALVGGADKQWTLDLLNTDDEHVQAWAVRRLAETAAIDRPANDRLVRLLPFATQKVRLEIVSALQRIPPRERWQAATSLLESFPPYDDPNLVPMTWFAIEPLAAVDLDRFLALARLGHDNTRTRPIRQFIARRTLGDDPTNLAFIDRVLDLVRQSDAHAKTDLLSGMRSALAGERVVRTPNNWMHVRASIAQSLDKQLGRLADELAVKFRERTAIARLQRVTSDPNAPPDERAFALRVLAENRVDGVLELLVSLLDDEDMRHVTITQLGIFNVADVPRELLSRFAGFSAAEQAAAVWALVSSPAHATKLLQAVDDGRIPASAIQPSQALAMYQLQQAGIRRQLRDVWGDLRLPDEEKRQRIADWKARLSEPVIAQADLQNGARVFEQNCGKCHKLFGKGHDIGPDLTGSDRRNLDYVLQNVITPSAVVGKDYRLQTILLKDGRIISGVVREQSNSSIVLQTAEQRITIARREIMRIQPTNLSLMPEAQLDAMPQNDVRDLIGYLASDPQ